MTKWFVGTFSFQRKNVMCFLLYCFDALGKRLASMFWCCCVGIHLVYWAFRFASWLAGRSSNCVLFLCVIELRKHFQGLRFSFGFPNCYLKLSMTLMKLLVCCQTSVTLSHQSMSQVTPGVRRVPSLFQIYFQRFSFRHILKSLQIAERFDKCDAAFLWWYASSYAS